MAKPYQSVSVCPECSERRLHDIVDANKDLSGVRCGACKFACDLRPFPLPGAMGYFVGSDGRAWSIRGPGGRNGGGLRAMRPKMNRGFARVRISIDGHHYYPYLAPAILSAFARPRPPGFDVRHKDGDSANCALENIEWALVRANQTSAEQFVRVWQSSETVQDVADRLGMRLTSVATRAHTLRKHGVALKALTHRGRTLDWASLAILASSLANGHDPGE